MVEKLRQSVDEVFRSFGPHSMRQQHPARSSTSLKPSVMMNTANASIDKGHHASLHCRRSISSMTTTSIGRPIHELHQAQMMRPHNVGRYEPREAIALRRSENSTSELASFLQTRAPPPSNWISVPGKGERGSGRSWFGRRKTKKSTNQLLQLPDSAVATKTADGHWYIAIHIPGNIESVFKRSKSTPAKGGLKSIGTPAPTGKKSNNAVVSTSDKESEIFPPRDLITSPIALKSDKVPERKSSIETLRTSAPKTLRKSPKSIQAAETGLDQTGPSEVSSSSRGFFSRLSSNKSKPTEMSKDNSVTPDPLRKEPSDETIKTTCPNSSFMSDATKGQPRESKLPNSITMPAIVSSAESAKVSQHNRHDSHYSMQSDAGASSIYSTATNDGLIQHLLIRESLRPAPPALPKSATAPDLYSEADSGYHGSENHVTSSKCAEEATPAPEYGSTRLQTRSEHSPDLSDASDIPAPASIPELGVWHDARKKANTQLESAQLDETSAQIMIETTKSGTYQRISSQRDSISRLQAAMAQSKLDLEAAMADGVVEIAVKAAKEAAEAQAAIRKAELEISNANTSVETIIEIETQKLKKAQEDIRAAKQELESIDIAEAIAEQERREAEARAEREKIEAEEKAERERKEAKERAERERKEAEEKSKRERLEAEAKERERKRKEDAARKRAEALAAVESKAVAEARAAFEQAEREAEEERMKEASELNNKPRADTTLEDISQEVEKQVNDSFIDMTSTSSAVDTLNDKKTNGSLKASIALAERNQNTLNGMFSNAASGHSSSDEVREMELRLRKMEESNKMMVQTLNAVVSMGQGFRDLTNLLANSEMKTEIGKSLAKLEPKNGEANEHIPVKAKRLEELKKELNVAR